MKKLTCLVLALCFGVGIRAQSCLPDGISFSSQAEIDNFPANYPGCTVIEGSVRISGTGITNLNGLNAVTAIGDSLFIFDCVPLSSLTGLSNLAAIGGSLEVYNTRLVIMEGLENLHTVGGNLTFADNNFLQSLDGLQNLSSLGGYIRVQNNPAFVALSALSGLPDTLNSVYLGGNNFYSLGGLFDGVEVVRGDLVIGGTGIYLEPLKNLKKVGGSLSIQPFYTANLAWLDNLESAGGVSINCLNIPDLDGFPKLTRIDGDFWISNGNILTDFSGLNELTYLGALILYENNGLTRVTGLNNVDTIGNINIQNNPALQQLDGLDQLTTVLSDISLWNNPQMASFGGFDQIRTVGGQIYANGSWKAPDLSAFQNLDSVGTDMIMASAYNLTSLQGLGKLRHIRGLLLAWCDGLSSLAGMDSLTEMGALGIYSCSNLTDFSGLENLKAIRIELAMSNAQKLVSMNGLGSMESLGDLFISNCGSLTTLVGFGPLKTIDTLSITWDGTLTPLSDLRGLDSLQTITGDLILEYLPNMDSLVGLEQLTRIDGDVRLSVPLKTLSALSNLGAVGGAFNLEGTGLLNLEGLTALHSVQSINLKSNYYLVNLKGLDSLTVIEDDLSLTYNASLSDLNGLNNLKSVGGNINISYNETLSDCAIQLLCDRITLGTGPLPGIHDNAAGCSSPAEVALQCGGSPLRTRVLLDNNNNCIADDGDTPAADIQVLLTDPNQMTLRAANAQGLALFYHQGDNLTLSLPQFPAGNWGVCRDTIAVDPDTLSSASLTTFLLKPLNPCPELTLDLSMPAFFRGCFVSSYLGIHLNNTGAVPAKNFVVALILPPVFEMVNAWPGWPSTQNGDTLFWDFTGTEMPPFAPGDISVEVRTKCDTFLFEHTLCVETFVIFQNPCASTPIAFSEIKLSSECMGDTTVRFTLTNIGDAPTQSQHRYTVFQNENPVSTDDFSLNAQQSINVDLPADGSTWRMEATKFDDGTLTATALENCGGLTPGLITSFWLDDGPPGYDMDCRKVVLAYDPNLKSAVPTGIGPEYSIAADRKLQYTIDFQNTGTDTAYRVQLRDVLPSGLDVSTFRPSASSHPCVWEIRGGDTLEVLFLPIFLPDSNVNEPASHGYFSFEIDLKPGLPVGTKLENTAAIVFDFNPPIVTNTVLHTIGRNTLQAKTPDLQVNLWHILGNPTRDIAIFRAETEIAGEKRFDLFDAQGKPVRTARFAGQSFEFRRQGLPGGCYFFYIREETGRRSAGTIVVLD
ncbi:MAG: leucine-rich repeat protein [Saprospiraceae bacterium]